MTRKTLSALALAVSLGASSGSALAAPHSTHTSKHHAKKKKASHHGVLQGWLVPKAEYRADELPRPSGRIVFYAVNFRETLEVNIYNADGSMNEDALDQLDHLFRCKRTGTEKPIEPHLFEVLSTIYDHYQKPIELVSGFRNQKRVTSFHFHGSASDIRIPGVPDKELRDYVATLDTGNQGLGLYPKAGFIHVDVRPEPSYRWVDWSPPGTSDLGHPHNKSGKKKKHSNS